MVTLGGTDVVIYNPDPVTSVTYAPPIEAGVVVVPVVGPPGPAGAAFIHTAVTPVPSETFTHTLGRLPNVALYIAGEPVEADYTATTTTVSVTFPTPTAYTAVLT